MLPRSAGAARLRPPESERTVGLEFYATTTDGVEGTLKGEPSDFRVSEISSYPPPDPTGAFSVVRVQSRNWEQHELGEALARRLHLAPHSVQWAGTKDRRAVAERLFSYRGPPPPPDLHLPEVELLDAYRAREGLSFGHHYGNSFGIRVTELGAGGEEAIQRFRTTLDQLHEIGGFPNFFGLQRFGEVRPVTHLVGRRLVQGDTAGAVEVYLTEVTEGIASPGVEARQSYARHRDARRALAEFPPEYRFERQLLEHLARGNTPDRALRALSRELRLLFVHAYQSLLFNRWMSRRWRAGLSLFTPSDGDVLLRMGRDGTIAGTHSIPVTRDNLSECTEFVRRGRARVAGPLVGFETPSSGGIPGELLEALLEEEAVARPMFRLPHQPEVASRGSWRPVSVPTPPLGLLLEARTSENERSASGHQGVSFRFALPKGAYATVLLREFLKSGATATAADFVPSNAPY